MKLCLLIAVSLCVSSASGSFFKKKSSKVVDIHISKGPASSPPSQPGQAPVGQGPFIGFLPQGHLIEDHFVPAKHVQVGHVQVGPVPPHRAPVRGSLGLPVLSQHSVQYVPVHAETPYFQPQLVSVEPNVQAVQLLFKSASSPLLVQQKHFSSHGSVYQATHSQDAPHVLRHYVTKPVLQEVREVIQPFRHITTQIQPVQERVQTILPVQKAAFQPGYFGQTGSQVHFRDQWRQTFVPNHWRYQNPPGKGQPPVEQEPIEQEPIEQEPEPIEQHPTKGI